MEASQENARLLFTEDQSLRNMIMQPWWSSNLQHLLINDLKLCRSLKLRQILVIYSSIAEDLADVPDLWKKNMEAMLKPDYFEFRIYTEKPVHMQAIASILTS